MLTYSLIKFAAFSASLKDIHLAVGILCRSINALANSLLDSICAALADGPKQEIPMTTRNKQTLIPLILLLYQEHLSFLMNPVHSSYGVKNELSS